MDRNPFNFEDGTKILSVDGRDIVAFSDILTDRSISKNVYSFRKFRNSKEGRHKTRDIQSHGSKSAPVHGYLKHMPPIQQNISKYYESSTMITQ